MAGELALKVARAALLEVGGDGPMWLTPDESIPNRVLLWGYPDTAKARYIGLAAEFGGDYVVRCSTCHSNVDWPPCTPVRDVLRGVTCVAADSRRVAHRLLDAWFVGDDRAAELAEAELAAMTGNRYTLLLLAAADERRRGVLA